MYTSDGKIHWRWRKKKFNTHENSTRLVALTHPLSGNRANKANLSGQETPKSKTIAEEVKKAKEDTADAPDFIDPLGATFEGLGIGPKSSFVDPLLDLSENNNKPQQNGFIGDSSDPLLRNTLDGGSPEKARPVGFECDDLADFLPWSTHRHRILKQFTTTEKLSIVISSGIVPGGEASSTQSRLEQFDDRFASNRQSDLTQQEYVERVSALSNELKRAWDADQRVQSVKLVIECARLLSNVSVPHFYPSQFVLVTDILDSFGEMVFERLLLKANAERKGKGLAPLQDGFSVSDVPEGTRETATNWFYKVACVKELLPRCYVEMSLLPCRRFTNKPAERDVNDTTYRLATSIRGLSGNPLLAMYARCYLCRCALRVCPISYKQHVWRCIHDSVQTWMPNTHSHIYQLYRKPQLFTPALLWLCQCVSHSASVGELLPLWEYCKQQDAICSLLLPAILSTLPAHHVAGNAIELCQLIVKLHSNAQTELEVLVTCITTFGQRLIECEPSPDIHRLLLRHIWRCVMKLTSVHHYIQCAVVWLRFTCAHFAGREINTLLEDIIRHVGPDEAFADYYDELLAMLEDIVGARYLDFCSLFGMSYFVPFLDMFQKETVNLKACQLMLSAFVQHAQHPSQQSIVCNDVSLAAQILSLCRTLHDSLNACSIADQRLATASLINRALEPFTFESNPQQMLDFLIDARGGLTDLDQVIQYLVQRCNRLVMSVHASATRQGTMNRRTAALLRACIAYTYITVPSIVSPSITLKLYIQSASVALIVCCLPQAEAMLKAAIQLVAEWPASSSQTSEHELVGWLSELLSCMLVMPDSPDHSQPLYLFNGLCNAVNKYAWQADSEQKCLMLVNMLHWLSAQAQPSLPYHIDGVESNDTLYGGEQSFIDAIQKCADQILTYLSTQLNVWHESDRRRARTALALLECCLCWADIKQVAPSFIESLSQAAAADPNNRKVLSAIHTKLRDTV